MNTNPNKPQPDWEGFGRAIMEEWQYHYDIDTSTKFKLALDFNILLQVPGGFNPLVDVDIMGDAEEGDPWYVENFPKPE